MPEVFSKDGVKLFEATDTQAERILRACPRIVRAKSKGGRITIRMSYDRIVEFLQDGYFSRTSSLQSHYKHLLSNGMWCWSQKQIDNFGQLVKWNDQASFGAGALLV